MEILVFRVGRNEVIGDLEMVSREALVGASSIKIRAIGVKRKVEPASQLAPTFTLRTPVLKMSGRLLFWHFYK